MAVVSKIIGVASNQVAKFTGTMLKSTRTTLGVPYTHYFKTGTNVLKDGGMKSIVLGKGNRLSQYVKQIVSYPKGFLGDSSSKTIVLFGANNKPFFVGTPKEVGEYLKDWKEFVDVLKQSANYFKI